MEVTKDLSWKEAVDKAKAKEIDAFLIEIKTLLQNHETEKLPTPQQPMKSAG